MAAFTYPNPDGTYSIFYAANDLDTATAETKRHREQFLSATNQAHMELDMRGHQVDLDGDLHDPRGQVEGIAHANVRRTEANMSPCSARDFSPRPVRSGTPATLGTDGKS